MFTPFRCAGMTLVNRVVVSPMDMYTATDGTPDDFHLVHLGARALGGAGLVLTEMTCVVSGGPHHARVRRHVRDEHVPAWRRIVDSCTGTAMRRSAFSSGTPGRKAR